MTFPDDNPKSGRQHAPRRAPDVETLAASWHAHAGRVDALLAAEESPTAERLALDNRASRFVRGQARIEEVLLATPAGTLTGISGKIGIALAIATIALGADELGVDWMLVASAARDLAALAAGTAA